MSPDHNMRVICIDNINNHLDLTIGKEYYIIQVYWDYYRLRNDLGDFESYSMDFFMPIEEYRNSRLEEIGI